MTSLTGCSGGGWTLVMKIDGRKVCKRTGKVILERVKDMYNCEFFVCL